jgi:hypothetical protein
MDGDRNKRSGCGGVVDRGGGGGAAALPPDEKLRLRPKRFFRERRRGILVVVVVVEGVVFGACSVVGVAAADSCVLSPVEKERFCINVRLAT